MARTETDIFVAGGGVAGLAAALAFARAGFGVVLASPALPVTDGSAAGSDLRSTAFLQPARRLFDEIGLWPSLADIASASILAQEEPESATPRVLTLHPGDHETLRFDSDVQLLVPPDEQIVSYKPIDQANWILIGKEIGTTALTAELSDGALTSLVVRVVRDITLLQEALEIIDPTIQASIARDRDAVLLRGEVQDISQRELAYRTAIQFLDSRSTQIDVQISEDERATNSGAVQVLNLLSVREGVLTLEARLLDEFATLGADEITVRRVLRGSLPNDDEDLFVLEGAAPDQITLVRALEVAGRLVSARGANEESDVEVIADESGGLAERPPRRQGGARRSTVVASKAVVVEAGGFGVRRRHSASGAADSVATTCGRTSRASPVGPRSFEAGGWPRACPSSKSTTLPQVQRRDPRLRSGPSSVADLRRSDFGSLVGDVDVGNLAAPGLGRMACSERPAHAVGAGNDLDVLERARLYPGPSASRKKLQLAGSELRDRHRVSRRLETAGLAKQREQPESNAILSGEIASFSVGGQIPITQTFTPAFGDGDAGGAGTFSSAWSSGSSVSS